MPAPKFRAGDLVRIGGSRDLPVPDRPHLRVGRLVRISRVISGHKRGPRAQYVIAGRKGWPETPLDSRQLRTPEARYRRPGAHRVPSKE